MFALFQSNLKNERAKKAQAIQSALAEHWDLDRTFSLPGQGPANVLVETLNLLARRLHLFVLDLTKRNVETATVAPLTHAIAHKVRQSSESLSQRTEQIEATCRKLADGIGATADNANRALGQSASIVGEIEQTGSLTDQALKRMHVMNQDVDQLSRAITDLERKSQSIGSIIESISDIADNTGLLSLNAFIEAARAGVHGAGFGVIANEIRQLSQETAQAAQEVKDSLLGISELIQETVAAVARVQEGVVSGLDGNQVASAALSQVNLEHRRFHNHLESVIGAVSEQKKAVALLADDLARISTIGKEGRSDSVTLAKLAEKIKLLTEQQLLATGFFILPQYRKAERAVLAIAEDPDVRTPGLHTDQALQRCMQPLSYLELVYLTDAEGVQISSNVHREEHILTCDSSTKGKNWGGKMWFRKVRETGQSYISDIYKSEASDAFCLTISVPVYRDTVWVGVLGADIHFENLLHI
jgi:methyl-accepting chemotaxis protein